MIMKQCHICLSIQSQDRLVWSFEKKKKSQKTL